MTALLKNNMVILLTCILLISYESLTVKMWVHKPKSFFHLWAEIWPYVICNRVNGSHLENPYGYHDIHPYYNSISLINLENMGFSQRNHISSSPIRYTQHKTHLHTLIHPHTHIYTRRPTYISIPTHTHSHIPTHPFQLVNSELILHNIYMYVCVCNLYVCIYIICT